MIEDLEKRHSVRSFLKKELPTSLVNKIRSDVTYVNTHEAGLNFQLCFSDEKPFKGMRRSYGMFRNVSNYLAAVIDPTFPHAEERAGYFAEYLVVEMVKAGLGTCFVGGTFSREDVSARVEVYEKITFVVAFGYPDEVNTSLMGKLTARMAHRKQRDPDDLFGGSPEERQRLIETEFPLERALKAVQLSPSALNRQPVRLTCIQSEGGPCLGARVEDYNKNAVELGIAKYNVAHVIPGLWEWGNNQPFFQDPDF